MYDFQSGNIISKKLIQPSEVNGLHYTNVSINLRHAGVQINSSTTVRNNVLHNENDVK